MEFSCPDDYPVYCNWYNDGNYAKRYFSCVKIMNNVSILLKNYLGRIDLIDACVEKGKGLEEIDVRKI